MKSPVPGAGAEPPASLVDAYAPNRGGFDELVDGSGVVRPHLRAFIERLQTLGIETLQKRWDQARQLIHENGVSYNVNGDPQGLERPWNLSPLPVLLHASEFAELERGVAQRARLLDALLDDIYGAGTCLSYGLLPPEIVFGRPSFLRPMHGVTPRQGRRLVFYAADLVRGPDGQFRIFADRTQAPSGAGYALENRIVISQVLPDAFRDCNVLRLAPFFRTVQETLAAMSPHDRDNPRVVLLTPGPWSSTYFEQAYLAQYLAFTLVTGADLTVRDGRVFLKTLGGLQPVDVILRRVNDDTCDPLELRADTLLGVPGLAEACRSGHVAIANALGTGIVRTPALLPYLPELCRHFLGEPLALPSVPSWWCGDPQGLAEVRARFDDLVIKPSYTDSYVHPVFVGELSTTERTELLARVLARPADFVGQERVVPSTTPLVSGGHLEPRPMVLRTFAVAARADYDVMPGGLARVADRASGFEVAMQLGAGSKDTWILSDQPVAGSSLLPASAQPIALSRGGGDLPSRVADNLFWLGRYAERAESTARTARVLLTRLGHADFTLAEASEIGPLAAALAAQTEIGLPAGQSAPTQPDLLAATLAAVNDPRLPGSVAAAVRSTLQVARMVRDRLSLDSWKVLAALDTDLEPSRTGSASATLLADRLSRAILRLAAFSGLASESMTRGQAWRFLDVGRRLERAINLTLLLRHAVVRRCEREGPLLEALLEIADSAMTYRRRYLAALQVAPVVDLLLTDESNPRAVVFQIAALDGHLSSLPRLDDGVRSPQERLTLGLLAGLRLSNIDELCALDEKGERPALVAFLDGLARDLPALSNHLTERYLSHATLSRNLSADPAQFPTGGAPAERSGDAEP